MRICREGLLWLAAMMIVCGAVSSAEANLYINEIFFDPGGGGNEQRDEYIELRGTPSMSLANHFLVFVESEDNLAQTGGAGLIDNIFDLGSASIGSNGYLVLRQGGDQAGSGSSQYSVAPGTTDLVNSGTGPGYGSGATSTIGASDVGNEGVVENGAFSALLVRNDSGTAPVLGTDLDLGNDGLDNPNGQAGWTILDSITVFEPLEATFGQAYGQVVFGREDIGELVFLEGGIRTVDPGLEPGAEYLGTGFEVEHIHRWGNSTGDGVDDWHVVNLTDNAGSGSQGAPLDYRLSFTGDHGDLASGNINVPPSQPTPAQGELESTKGVPYGTPLLTNLGAPNFILGDYNGDGVVNIADYTVYRDTEGQTANELAAQPADHDRSFVVDIADYNLWTANFGGPAASSSSSSSASIPEPAGIALLLIGAIGLCSRR